MPSLPSPRERHGAGRHRTTQSSHVGHAMTLDRRWFLNLSAATAALPALPRLALAQTYPDRPVRMVVPYAPGGPTDAITRVLAQKMSERIGKQFYVENIGGG